MQTTWVAVSSSSTNYQRPAVVQNTQIPWLKTQSLRPKTSSRHLKALCKSLKTSLDFHNDHGFSEQNLKGPVLLPLPIVFCNSGSVSRYFWDGNGLKLVSLDGNSLSLLDFRLGFGDGVRKFGRICGCAVRNFFLPREFGGNYLEYVKWKLLHRVFSSALQVLATQAMFRAIGIGFSRSLPSAAALNWVLKDGLGRLSRCIYTASLASSFDTNLKRVRFSTSVLFTLSIGVELLTPAFPQYFLLLASVANIAKQISLACYLATGTAVHKSFAVADNLGEVSAKAQIQTVCFDNLGLLLAATLNIALKNNPGLQAALPFAVYPIFSALDLVGIYQGLKHVHLQTLTKERLDIIINTWVHQGYVPSPAEVSKAEGIGIVWSKGRNLWPIRIGCLNPKSQLAQLSLYTIQALRNDNFYFICMEGFRNGLTGAAQQGIVLCLREGSSYSDVIMGFLQACYMRKDLLHRPGMWGTNNEVCDGSHMDIQEWLHLSEESKQLAQENLDVLVEEMSRCGWSYKNILLSVMERTKYSFVADPSG